MLDYNLFYRYKKEIWQCLNCCCPFTIPGAPQIVVSKCNIDECKLRQMDARVHVHSICPCCFTTIEWSKNVRYTAYGNVSK